MYKKIVYHLNAGSGDDITNWVTTNWPNNARIVQSATGKNDFIEVTGLDFLNLAKFEAELYTRYPTRKEVIL